MIALILASAPIYITPPYKAETQAHARKGQQTQLHNPKHKVIKKKK